MRTNRRGEHYVMLSGTDVSDQSLRELEPKRCALPDLIEISLSDTKTADAALLEERLGEVWHLRTLQSCRKQPEATERFASGPVCRRAGSLSFSYNFSDRSQRNRRKSSTPDRIRTCNPRFRRPMLYPIELRALAPWQRPLRNAARDFLARVTRTIVEFLPIAVKRARIARDGPSTRPGRLA